MTRLKRMLVLLAVTLTACLAISATAQAAGEVGVPVIIDAFGNPNFAAGPFTRSVIPLPTPGTSIGTPQGTFSQSNAVATMKMSGAGTGISGTTLQYVPTSGAPVDLTGGGTDAQIFIDFALIDQVPAPGDLSVPGATTFISATDANGNVATSPSDAVGNFFAFNAAFPFTGFQTPTGFDFTKVTQLDISFVYPSGNTGGGSLEVQVNKLWATPESGSPPSPPSPTVTGPSVTGCGSVDFTVSFTSNEGAAPVTFDPPSDIGVRAQDLTVAGTAFGGATPTVHVSGGPSTYTVAVSGMTQSGGITLDVPAGIVDDAWAQLNTASSNDPTVPFTLPVPPSFKSAAGATFTVGSPSTFTADATGGSPAPIPQLSIISGSLPSGLSFQDNGDGTASITGKPAAGTGGVVALTLQATNCVATVTQGFTLTNDEPPSITSPAAATSTVGSLGGFMVTTGHDFPAATALSIPAGALPPGVSFKDNGDGTASISGTPAVGDGGVYSFDVTASNGITPDAVMPFTLTIDEPPSITTPAAATFTVGSLGGFMVTTGHDFPAAALSIPAGSLPSGVSFQDNGDGTASISGTPAVGDGGVYSFDVTASNGITPDAVIPFTLTIDEPPSITSPAAATFRVGSLGGFMVTTGHDFPAATALSIPAGALPPGVSFKDNGDGTASISGTPAAGDGGEHHFDVTASNGIAPDGVMPLTLTIDEPPLITSPAAATFTAGSLGGFTITVGHDFPVATALSIPAGALPPGVSFRDNGDGTASISGTPAAGDGGVRHFDVTASNGIAPDAVMPFTLTIDEPTAVAVPAAPSVQITSPTVGARYLRGQSVSAGYRCQDAANGPGLASCAGTVAAGKPIDTGTLGQHTFTVTATSKDGRQAERTVTYTVALPDNEFTITRVRTERNGTVRFTLTLPGAGTADVLETAWRDNFASTATLLAPAPRRFVFARAHLDVSSAGAIVVTVAPNRRGKQLVARHRRQIVIRLWVSYTPADGTQRNIGRDGLHITHVDHKGGRHAN